ncbi:hypothetical protein CBR_g17698 [Chara braunii]|uniref:Vesicle transport protein n=1 Tax=Chara braunii TaxID=69332 RepID=A0A388KVB9_CHABU|nr:hypothetical protein CBR_g17698 [Chara braunii]|eukprot:GBG73987.1 hypothetical protein CBR_g17698 [Chara braunii]
MALGFAKLKSILGIEEAQEEQTMQDELNEMCNLTYEQRMYGFGICLGLGILCAFLSSLLLFSPTRFAIVYTFANILCLGSTGFLIGPLRQVKMMFDKSRAVATIIYLGAMVLTLVAALRLKIVLLTIIFIIIQMCAFVWYCLSYIPFARRMVQSCFQSCA